MNVNDIVRLKLLDGILENMSDEDRRSYAVLLGQRNIADRISSQEGKLDELIERTSWTKSFFSDVSANVLTNAAFLLLAKLFK